jgi:hypothetical protein
MVQETKPERITKNQFLKAQFLPHTGKPRKSVAPTLIRKSQMNLKLQLSLHQKIEFSGYSRSLKSKERYVPPKRWGTNLW